MYSIQRSGRIVHNLAAHDGLFLNSPTFLTIKLLLRQPLLVGLLDLGS